MGASHCAELVCTNLDGGWLAAMASHTALHRVLEFLGDWHINQWVQKNGLVASP